MNSSSGTSDNPGNPRCNDCQCPPPDNSAGAYSPESSVRYFDGQGGFTPDVGFTPTGFPGPVGLRAGFNNLSEADGTYGHGWTNRQVKTLVATSGGFEVRGGVYATVPMVRASPAPDPDLVTCQWGGLETLSEVRASPGSPVTERTFNKTDGGIIAFHGDTASLALRGRTRETTSPGGHKIDFTYDSAARLEKQSTTAGGKVRELVFTYSESAALMGKLTQTVLIVDGVELERELRDCYGPMDEHGSLGDLKGTTRQKWIDGQWVTTQRTWHRYHAGHLLAMTFDEGGLQRIAAAGLDVATATNAELLPWSLASWAYGGSRRVSTARGPGGTAAIHYSYTNRENPPATPNAWAVKTTETLPNGSQRVVYTNHAGMMLLTIHQPVNPTGTTPVRYWFRQYNAGYRVELDADSAAIASVTQPTGTTGELAVELSANTGAIQTFTFYPSDADGGAIGQLHQTTRTIGTEGPALVLSTTTYTTRGDFGQPRTTKPATATNALSEETTSERDWIADTFQDQTVTSTPPIVPLSENGSGIAEPRSVVHDSHGRTIWEKNPRGFLDHHTYDAFTGAPLQSIEDVDTAIHTAPNGWTTPAGGGKNLVTDYQSDALGRVLRTIGPLHNIQINPADTTATPVRRVDYSLRNDASHTTRSASGYVIDYLGENEAWFVTSPISVSIGDGSGRTLQSFECPRAAGVTGPLTLTEALPQSAWTRRSDTIYDEAGRPVAAHTYHLIPPVGNGIPDVNYSISTTGYDASGRANRQTTPGGTISRAVFDVFGNTISQWTGTDDTGATDSDPAGTDPANNMNPIWLGIYNDNDPAADRVNLTSETLPVSNDPAADRAILHTYDQLNRRLATTVGAAPEVLISGVTYDDLNRVIARTGWHTAQADANRISHGATYFDKQGRDWKTETHGANSDGTLTAPLTDLKWFGYCGKVIKSIAAGQAAAVKTSFDSLGRAVKTSLVVDGNPTPPGTGPWGGILPNDITADTVIEQTLTTYDDASNVISTTRCRRFHNATGTGDLQGPSGTEPKSRDTFVASWPDPISRPVTTANYGTNGGSTFTRPDIAPAASDTILVSVTAYNEAGEPWQRTAPDGIINRVIRDAASRTIETIENYSTTGGGPDANRTTLFTYTPGGQLQTLTLVNPDTGHQTTTWTYGSTLADSGIASGALLQTKTFPNGDASSYTYNRQGQRATHTDANGTVHAFDYDVMGRSIHDRIASLASGVDGTIRRLSRAYNERGQLATASSATDPTPGQGAIANQVAFTYDAFGQLTADQQEHNGAVDANTPEVTYAYENGGSGTIRRTATTIPGGQQLDCLYGTGGGIDDTLNRIFGKKVNGEGTNAVSYQYMGANTLVQTSFPQPGILCDAFTLGQTGSAGDIYTALDSFGRLLDKTWNKTTTTLVQAIYGYDRGSRRLYRQDGVGTAQDNLYTYDALSQVTGDQRGTLNANKTAITGTPATQEDFIYDPTGNWNAYDHFTAGTQDIDQARVNNVANQIGSVNDGTGNIPFAYDPNGNATSVPTGPALDGASHTLKWDAWNRLVQVKDDNDTVIQSNQYDALHRRTSHNDGTTEVHQYYNDQWRIVAEGTIATSTFNLQTSYAWGLNRWQPLFRERDTTGNGTLDERLYILSDAMDPVAVADTGGTVMERYRYTAFGQATIMAPDFTPRTNNQSDHAWNLLYHVEHQDEATGWHNYGFRFYAPEQGRWLSRDPIEEKGGVNLYGFAKNDGVGEIDVLGMFRTFVEALDAATNQVGEAARESREKGKQELSQFFKFRLLDQPTNADFQNSMIRPFGIVHLGVAGKEKGAMVLCNPDPATVEETYEVFGLFEGKLPDSLGRDLPDGNVHLPVDRIEAVEKGKKVVATLHSHTHNSFIIAPNGLVKPQHISPQEILGNVLGNVFRDVLTVPPANAVPSGPDFDYAASFPNVKHYVVHEKYPLPLYYTIPVLYPIIEQR